MSIVNGLFAGRAGISSHGSAIAVVGDNISNSSTIAYKSSRAEFNDLIAGGQTAGRTIGSGSQLSAVTSNFSQGTLEFTSRPLDLAIDGNGFFVVADGPQRFYTRAGNFRTDESGNLVDQNGYSVLGFPANGTGALAPLNLKGASSSATTTTGVSISGNIDASSTEDIDIGRLTGTAPSLQATNAGADGTANTLTYADLSGAAAFQTALDVVDSLGRAHTMTVFFFKNQASSNSWTAAAYVNSDDVDPLGALESGEPRFLGSTAMTFGTNGSVTAGGTITATNIPWNNGSDVTGDITIDLAQFTQFAANSNVNAISQNGQGVGAVTSVSISGNGEIFALLDNGENTVIGTIGLANFANEEGLQRVGSNLLAQSNDSGEPIQGSPASGTFGTIQSGSLELSTTDIATEFVKLITLQRGFQANSRIITSIDQLLNEIIQLA